jgi:hypothetical protein
MVAGAGARGGLAKLGQTPYDNEDLGLRRGSLLQVIAAPSLIETKDDNS